MIIYIKLIKYLEVISLFSMPIVAKNKNGLIEIFETLSHFPDVLMMLRSGDYTVDAHSLIGVFSIDVSRPMELLLEKEPDDEFKQAVMRFVPALV